MYYWTFGGMHALWWLFWVLLVISFFWFATPVPRSRARLYDDPIDILRRRFARGEINAAEFEERRAVLERDDTKGTISDPAVQLHSPSTANATNIHKTPPPPPPR